jgi:hypothetical protein
LEKKYRKASGHYYCFVGARLLRSGRWEHGRARDALLNSDTRPVRQLQPARPAPDDGRYAARGQNHERLPVPGLGSLDGSISCSSSAGTATSRSNNTFVLRQHWIMTLVRSIKVVFCDLCLLLIDTNRLPCAHRRELAYVCASSLLITPVQL